MPQLCWVWAGVESNTPPQALIAVDDGYFRHSNLPRFAGVATPVFSLRTLRSVGSGEFADIERLADLCGAIGTSAPSCCWGVTSGCCTALQQAEQRPVDVSTACDGRSRSAGFAPNWWRQNLTSLKLCCPGLRLIQLLPVNDTTVYNMWWDSYPYCSVSVSAAHACPLSGACLLMTSTTLALDQSTNAFRCCERES